MLNGVQWCPGKGPAMWLTAWRLTALHFLQAAGTGGRAPAMGWSQSSPSPPRPCLSQQRCRRAPIGTAVWVDPTPWGIAATALLWTTFSAPVRLVPAAATTRQTQVSPNVQVPGGPVVSWCWALVAQGGNCSGAQPPCLAGQHSVPGEGGGSICCCLQATGQSHVLVGGGGGGGGGAVFSTGQDVNQQDGALRPVEAGGRDQLLASSAAAL